MDIQMKMTLINELLESDDEYPEFIDDESDTSSSDSSSVSEASIEEHSVVSNFIETIQNYTADDFKKHFRLNRSTVNHLTELYQNSEAVKNQQKGGRACVDAEKQIFIFLWYMGNTNTFREIGNLFGISKSAAWNVVSKVSIWLISIGHNYLKWPSQQEVPSLINVWEQKKKIPFVIGAIDCSHIKIKAPMENKESYFNRKHYYSVHLQAVVDINKKFRDIFVGEPGSLHDSRVLKRSELFLHENKERIFPHNSLLLGDLAYPLSDWIITPFRDNGHLSREQTQFNTLHSSARIVVENAFGMLKTRFRRLMHFTEQVSLNSIINLIVSGCILHNICLNGNDDFIESTELDIREYEQEEFVENEPIEVINRRQQILNYLISKGVIT